MADQKPVFIILGPTASGKTALAVRLAERISGEIISADSRQVFHGMDIGSGKDLSEYGSIPYHLIDIRPAGSEYSVSEFQEEAMFALVDISGRGRFPIICGGTGYYVKALLEDYSFPDVKSDLAFTNKLENLPRPILYRIIKKLGIWDQRHWKSDSPRRMARAIEKNSRFLVSSPPKFYFNDLFKPYIYYISIDRSSLISRIEKRLKSRLDSGLIEEVESLLASGLSHDRLERYGLEYRWGSRYVRGDINIEELFDKLSTDIRRFAKRQMTFIRYLQKSGHLIKAISDPGLFLDQVETILSSNLSVDSL